MVTESLIVEHFVQFLCYKYVFFSEEPLRPIGVNFIKYIILSAISNVIYNYYVTTWN